MNIENIVKLIDKGLSSEAIKIIGREECKTHRDNVSKTAVHAAIWKKDKAIFGALIGAGYPIDERDENGDTPLHYAAWNGFNYAIEKLIAHGASIDKKNLLGETPLTYACSSGNASAQTILARNGADIERIRQEHPNRYQELAPLVEAQHIKNNAAISRKNKNKGQAIGM